MLYALRDAHSLDRLSLSLVPVSPSGLDPQVLLAGDHPTVQPVKGNYASLDPAPSDHCWSILKRQACYSTPPLIPSIVRAHRYPVGRSPPPNLPCIPPRLHLLASGLVSPWMVGERERWRLHRTGVAGIFVWKGMVNRCRGARC
jgi:hypothetical protein